VKKDTASPIAGRLSIIGSIGPPASPGP
jgi:hypothetical protein